VRPEIAAEIAAAKANYNGVMAFKMPLSMTFVLYWGKAAIWNSGCGDFVDKRRTAGLEGLRQRQLQLKDEKIRQLEGEVKSQGYKIKQLKEEVKNLKHAAAGKITPTYILHISDHLPPP
jgi:hypothetical protein